MSKYTVMAGGGIGELSFYEQVDDTEAAIMLWCLGQAEHNSPLDVDIMPVRHYDIDTGKYIDGIPSPSQVRYFYRWCSEHLDRIEHMLTTYQDHYVPFVMIDTIKEHAAQTAKLDDETIMARYECLSPFTRG